MRKRSIVFVAVAVLLLAPAAAQAEPAAVATSAVPEPITLALLASGVMGLVASALVHMRRRKRNPVA